MSKASEVNTLMRSIMIHQQRKYEDNTRDYNVSRSQARTLEYLRDNPGVNQRQLATHFNHREASTSGLLKNLEKLGYIEKHVNKGSQDRSKKIYLTDEGRKVTDTIGVIFTETESEALNGLNDNEIDELISLLNKINASMKE